jgi:hypothetical protein
VAFSCLKNQQKGMTVEEIELDYDAEYFYQLEKRDDEHEHE